MAAGSPTYTFKCFHYKCVRCKLDNIRPALLPASYVHCPCGDFAKLNEETPSPFKVKSKVKPSKKVKA